MQKTSFIADNDDETLTNYAKPIVVELRANMVRVKAKTADDEEAVQHLAK